MNAACPECSSVFRVDPAKVPAGGVRARCSVCGAVMRVEAPAGFGDDAWSPPAVASAGLGAAGAAATPGWGSSATDAWRPRPATPAGVPSVPPPVRPTPLAPPRRRCR